MKRIITAILLASVCLLHSCRAESLVVRVSNPEGFDRSTEMVEIPVAEISKRIRPVSGESYIVKNHAGDVIPSQVTYDGKLIFQSGLGAEEEAEFIICTGKTAGYTPMTYARYIAERMDDFAWENDRVAFRMYGPALVATDGPSNGIDVWYKRTNALIIDKWYAADLAGKASYHDDNGEGLDDYKVGRTLGAGAMAPYAEGRLWLNGNYASQKILENGPLRTTFELIYNDIAVGDDSFAESRLISIDAGSQFSRVTQSYAFREPTEVAAGFPMRGGDDVFTSSDDWLLFAEPATPKSNGVFLSVIFPQGIDRIATDSYSVPEGQKGSGEYSHVLAVTTYEPERPITYYTGYGWARYGFATMEDFRICTENFARALASPLIVEY